MRKYLFLLLLISGIGSTITASPAQEAFNPLLPEFMPTEINFGDTLNPYFKNATLWEIQDRRINNLDESLYKITGVDLLRTMKPLSEENFKKFKKQIITSMQYFFEDGKDIKYKDYLNFLMNEAVSKIWLGRILKIEALKSNYDFNTDERIVNYIFSDIIGQNIEETDYFLDEREAFRQLRNSKNEFKIMPISLKELKGSVTVSTNPIISNYPNAVNLQIACKSTTWAECAPLLTKSEVVKIFMSKIVSIVEDKRLSGIRFGMNEKERIRLRNILLNNIERERIRKEIDIFIEEENVEKLNKLFSVNENSEEPKEIIDSWLNKVIQSTTLINAAKDLTSVISEESVRDFIVDQIYFNLEMAPIKNFKNIIKEKIDQVTKVIIQKLVFADLLKKYAPFMSFDLMLAVGETELNRRYEYLSKNSSSLISFEELHLNVLEILIDPKEPAISVEQIRKAVLKKMNGQVFNSINEKREAIIKYLSQNGYAGKFKDSYRMITKSKATGNELSFFNPILLMSSSLPSVHLKEES
ncbi:MAG: hypothetical protein HOJ35_09165, partial [Bdellovibrionales bacterium]|nr:hypothetical protein [Bdellovibrionales bacterium]